MKSCIIPASHPAPPIPMPEVAANEKLASGVSNTLGEANVWKTETLTVDSWQGNDYMHARYYSPNLGRFLSLDQVGGAVGSSQLWNRYSYVRNDPLNQVDRNGLWGEDVHFHLTRYLVMAATGDKQLADTTATQNQLVDKDSGANPLNLKDWDLHFMGHEKALGLFNAAAGPEAQGAALHSVQDSYSHRGFFWPLGHGPLGKLPDKTYLRQELAMAMASETHGLYGGDPTHLNRAFIAFAFSIRDSETQGDMWNLAFQQAAGEELPDIHVSSWEVDRVARYYRNQGYMVFVDGVLY